MDSENIGVELVQRFARNVKGVHPGDSSIRRGFFLGPGLLIVSPTETEGEGTKWEVWDSNFTCKESLARCPQFGLELLRTANDDLQVEDLRLAEGLPTAGDTLVVLEPDGGYFQFKISAKNFEIREFPTWGTVIKVGDFLPVEDGAPIFDSAGA